MSFRDWSGPEILRLLVQDGYDIPVGVTDEELRIFAEETYGHGGLRTDDDEPAEAKIEQVETVLPSIGARTSYASSQTSYQANNPYFQGSYASSEHEVPTAVASSAAIYIPEDEDKGASAVESVAAAPPIRSSREPQHRRGFDNTNRVAPDSVQASEWAPLDEQDRRRLEMDDEARYDLEYGEVELDVLEPPSIKAAREYVALHHPRTMDGRKYPLCGSTMGRLCFQTGPIGVGFDWLGEGAVSEMARYGAGLSLHFKILKFLFWMFFFASCISLPQLVLNTQNAEYGGGLHITTIGNLFPFTNRSFTFLCASASQTNSSASYLCRYSLQELASIYSFTTVVIVILFAAGATWVHYFIQKEAKMVSKLFLSLDKYSVFVPKVPPGCGEIPLAQYFEEHTGEAVDEVNIAFNEGRLISLFRERGEVLSELWRTAGRALQVAEMHVKSTALHNEEEMLDFKMDRLERIVEYFDLLLSTYHTLNEETRGYSQAGTKALCAIVTFERRQGALKALEVFNSRRSNSRNCCGGRVRRVIKLMRKLICCLLFSPELAAKPSEIPLVDGEIPPLQGMRIKCQPAPPPSTVIWENFEFGWPSRLLRQLLAGLAVCVAIGVSFSASLGSQAYRAELRHSRIGECDLTATNVNPSADDPVSDCDCAMYPLARASSAVFEVHDPCHAYWSERAPLFAFTLFATAVVAFVNFVVTHITINLAYFERHQSIMDTALSVAGRLFIAYVINTAFVYVIVNIILGAPSELNSDWYSDVAVPIIITLIINVAAPHFVPAYEVIKSWILRHFGDKPLLQREMNERYVGGEFPFAVRSAQTLMQTFICLVFGPGMPLLYLIALISFGIFFWVDKWTVMRFYRTPPEYDARMAEMFVFVLWMSLVGNLCFAIWTYSSPGLFWLPSSGVVDQMSMREFVITRATLPHTLPLLVLLFFLVGAWVATYTLCFTWRSFLRSSKKSTTKTRKSRVNDEEIEIELNVKDDLPPLYDAKASGYLRGLKSYNILQNPVYRRAFGVPKAFCDEHQHVSSVLALPSGGDVVPELPEKVRRLIEEY